MTPPLEEALTGEEPTTEKDVALLDRGLKIPEQLTVRPATYEEGTLTVSLAWEVSSGTRPFVGLEYDTDNADLGEGIVQAVRGLRKEVSADDDTPGVLTLGEAGGIIAAAAIALLTGK